MDMGLFGASRSTSGRAGGTATRREPVPARSGSGEAAHDEPTVHRAAGATPHTVTAKKQPQQKKSLKWVTIVLAALLAMAIGWLVWQKVAAADNGIESSKYQAIFFTNGQVYFGKLTVLNDSQLKLTSVFYVQSQADSKAEKSEGEVATNQNNMQLIKMGNEVHGPEDAMIINRDQVLFYENLKSDGKVAQTINEYKDKK